MCVCVCVCLSVCQRGYLPKHASDITKFSVLVAYGCGSVFLWWGDEIPRGRSNFGDFLPLWQYIVQHSIWDHTKRLNRPRCRLGWWVGLARWTVCYVGVTIPEGKGAILGENMYPTSLIPQITANWTDPCSSTRQGQTFDCNRWTHIDSSNAKWGCTSSFVDDITFFPTIGRIAVWISLRRTDFA